VTDVLWVRKSQKNLKTIAMNKFCSLCPILTVAGLAATLAWMPRSVVAENKPPASIGSAQPGYDLEINDGQLVGAPKERGSEATLGNVVDSLRDRYKTFNIVLSPGLAKVKISDLKLRAGHLADELEAIRVASGLKFEWLGPGSAGPNLPPGSSTQTVDPTTGQLVATSPIETNTGLFILREPSPTAESARTVEAFNIGPYLQWLRTKQDPKEAQDRREQEMAKSLEELERIVAITLESLKQGSSVEMPSIRYHRGANLLIVTGTSEAVEVARKVVNALPGQAGQAAGETGPSDPFGGSGMSPEFAKRYGLLPPTAPKAPAPPR